MSVRVRFAPSPTGLPHVGNIRTALFDHLFAKHHGGTMILRIEDTDRTRFVEGAEENIMESLAYVGVEWDEGPDKGGPHEIYRQSERLKAGLYQPIIDRLLNEGHAYWAFDTPEELNEMREFQRINKQATGYFGGDWRDAAESQVEEAKASGKPGVIRLRTPRGEKAETIVVEDAIRGRVEVQSDTLDDPVLIKADGMPTYHFAAMTDDHLMDITHVFRGEEWISSAPKHIVFFRALGWEPPQFIHVPQIRGKDGKKLSKRHGDTACLDYRRRGYTGPALANFISLIGWAPGDDREAMTMKEMEEAFEIRGIQPSPGVFDPDKLDWMSGHHIRQMEPRALFEMTRDWSSCDENQEFWRGQEEGADTADKMALFHEQGAAEPDYVAAAVALEQERVVTLAEMARACDFFLLEELTYDEKAMKKWRGKEHIGHMFDSFIATISGMAEVTEDALEQMIRGYAADNGIERLGPVVHPTRLAMTGRTFGPGLWQLMAVLGKERLIKRFESAKPLLA